MINGISGILKVNSVDFIPQSQDTLEKTRQVQDESRTVSAFEKVLIQVLEKERSSTSTPEIDTYDCETYIYDSNSMYRDFQYRRREYTY